MTNRKDFRYKNSIFSYTKSLDGWRYYECKDTNKIIRCKGLKVEEIS